VLVIETKDLAYARQVNYWTSATAQVDSFY
jgi:hypothetical protein